MEKHSILSPSSAFRRRLCPGSRALEFSIPETKYSEAALEGTKAHEFAAQLFKSRIFSRENYPNITEEMYDAVLTYVNYVEHVINSLHWHKPDELKYHIEKRIDILQIHPECFGTPDVFFSTSGKEDSLHVIDFKYGFTPVQAYENWQMIAYAMGVIGNVFHKDIQYCFHIVQPRDFKEPIKTWTINYKEFKQYAESLRNSELMSLSPNAKLQPSPEACKFCKARAICPELTKQILTTDLTKTTWTSETIENELKQMHTLQQLLTPKITALEEQLFFYLNNGIELAHYELKRTYSREKWTIDKKQLREMGQVYQIDLFKQSEPLTPQQAIKAGIPKNIVDGCTIRTLGEPKVQPKKHVKHLFKGES